jgi:hypothetical protein
VRDPDELSPRILEQRVRNRVIEALELAASFEAQAAYERAVPFVNTPYEVINGFADWVSTDPRLDPSTLAVYTAEEVKSLLAFSDAWDTAARALPDDYPSVSVAQSLPEWSRLRATALMALAVFGDRGKMPEDHDVA